MRVFRDRSLAGATAVGISILALAFAASSSVSQSLNGDPGPAMERAPFGPGEKAEYQVKLGGIGVGNGSMEIFPIELVNGHYTYHARLHVHGGLPLARVDDKLDSWIDVSGLFSRRFEQNVHEIRYRRHRIYDFDPANRTFRQRGSTESQPMPTDRPLDDVAFLYYARTLPLKVGDTYTIPRYFKQDGNPVVLKVLRKETIEVPAGTFNTVVVQPIIQTDGLFGQGGQAEVYFSDDDRRILVYLRSRVPVVGSLSLHLRSYEPGTRLSTTISR
jgi:Protein of unknown function (DUF3108)